MASIEHAWLDTSRWPPLVQSYAAEPTDEVTEAFCAAVEKWARAKLAEQGLTAP